MSRHELQILAIVAGCVLVGLLIVLLAVSSAGKWFDACAGCRDPMPNGYEAHHDGKRYCRRCADRLGLKPWYHRSEMDTEPKEQPK